MLTIDQIMSAFRVQLEKVSINGKIKLTSRNQFDVVGKKAWDMLDIMLADSFVKEQEEQKAPKIEEQKEKNNYKKIFEKKVQDESDDDNNDESDDDNNDESDDDNNDESDDESDDDNNDESDDESDDDNNDESDDESDDDNNDESDDDLDMTKEEEKALDWLFIEWDIYEKDIEGKMNIDKLQGLLSSKIKTRAKKLKVNLFADKKYLIVKFNIGKKEHEEKIDVKKITKRYEKKCCMIHNFIVNKM